MNPSFSSPLLNQLTGQVSDHLILDPLIEVQLHKNAVEDFKKLQLKAAKAGFKLKAISGFRSFEQQLAIWNAKAIGQRLLLDSQGMPLDYKSLSPEQVVMSILRWSALPGMSRHHWGTDVDVIDSLALPSADYKVELTPQEVAPQGIFGPLHLWLDQLIDNGEACGFFRPYERDLGGVAPEKWHLSYAPQSLLYERELNQNIFNEFVQLNPALLSLEKREIVIEKRELIFKQFVRNTCEVPRPPV